MRLMKLLGWLAVGGLLLSAVVGCGGGGGGGNSPGVTISISPTDAMILVNHSQTFTASVLNASNPGVTWSVREGSNGGSVTSGGVYTAPSAAGTYHVVATSQQDTSKTATATVTVTTPAVSISILQPVANTIAPQALICSYRCSLWIATA